MLDLTKILSMNIEKLRCFFPVGGQAKRLRPLTHDISKPCIRFLNRPLIEFAMVTLAEQGVRNFIFGEYGYTNYSNLFDQYGEGIGFSAKYNIKPRVHIKHQPNLDDCGSADSFRLNMGYYDITDPVLVVQGDGLFNLNLFGAHAKQPQRKKFGSAGTAGQLIQSKGSSEKKKSAAGSFL